MATAQEAYNVLRPEFSIYTESELLSPTMDTPTTVGEAEELSSVIERDRDDLLNVKLDSALLDSYSDRIAAFVVAEAEYNSVRFAKSEALTEWRIIEPDVTFRKFDTIDIFRFIFEEQKMKDELKELNRISLGRGRRDMTVDYMDLHKMGTQYGHLFDTVGENGEEHVAYLAETFDKLRDLLGDINTTPAEVKEKELLAKQAFTHLQLATNAIRRRGQFAFRNNPEKHVDYVSDFHSARGKAAANTRYAEDDL